MTIDGRYHDATPAWLCIHKRWIVEPSNYAANKKLKNYNYGKPFKIRTESGDILSFGNQHEFAKSLGVETSVVWQWFVRVKKNPGKKPKIAGQFFYRIDEKK